ncbi:MAG: polyprenyl synthetase family protein [Desulfobacteraceae bacterium]|nr:MAG: polyprenyl synthetase family protein [Desulfobacteraceae bacterium]
MNAKDAKLNRFKPHLEKIDWELDRAVQTSVFNLEDLCRYSILGEGKRLRPLLFVLSAQLCGYQKADLYRLSILFELIHTGSLLHDDVLDNAEVRRKKPAARNVWGNPAAVLGGDYFYALATTLATESNNWNFLARLNQASIQMVEGQFLELAQTNNWQISKEQYLDIIQFKTAELISAACACGALLAGADESTVERLNRFGLNFGIAFQMMDDLLDYISSEEVFGKPVGNDLKEGKVTLPLIYTLEMMDRQEAERIENLFKNQPIDPKEYSVIIARVQDKNNIEKIQSDIKTYFIKSIQCLEPFPSGSVKEDLITLTNEMAQRTC